MASACSLLIVGASTRAAAFSALRAGLRPDCADLFADDDLVKRCPVTRIAGSSYPRGFAKFLRQAPEAPWIYTGGLENHPALIENLAAIRPLWGNNRQAAEAARSPVTIASILKKGRLSVPRICSPSDKPLVEERWLLKSVRSSGGRGVSWWRGASPAHQDAHYLQEYVAGEAGALLFVADGRGAALLGLTRQLVGEPWLYAKPFHYCGSIGPLSMPDKLGRDCIVLGNAVALGCGLRGLFGIDGIIRNGSFWPVEVNPRYTASVEIMELGLGRSVLSSHIRVFDPLFRSSEDSHRRQRLLGKAILFARKRIIFPKNGPWDNVTTRGWQPFAVPWAADIPGADTAIEAGRPVLTIFAEADSIEECLLALKGKTSEVEKMLY